MTKVFSVLIEGVIVFFLVYLCYYLFGYRRLKKYDRKKLPLGLNYLYLKYKLDIVRLGYKRVYKGMMFSDSIIVAALFCVTSFVSNTYIRIFIAFILAFPFFAFVYHILYNFYKKEIL